MKEREKRVVEGKEKKRVKKNMKKTGKKEEII